MIVQTLSLLSLLTIANSEQPAFNAFVDGAITFQEPTDDVPSKIQNKNDPHSYLWIVEPNNGSIYIWIENSAPASVNPQANSLDEIRKGRHLYRIAPKFINRKLVSSIKNTWVNYFLADNRLIGERNQKIADLNQTGIESNNAIVLKLEAEYEAQRSELRAKLPTFVMNDNFQIFVGDHKSPLVNFKTVQATEITRRAFVEKANDGLQKITDGESRIEELMRIKKYQPRLEAVKSTIDLLNADFLMIKEIHITYTDPRSGESIVDFQKGERTTRFGKTEKIPSYQ